MNVWKISEIPKSKNVKWRNNDYLSKKLEQIFKKQVKSWLMPISFLKFNKILIEKYVEFYILPLKSRHVFTFAIISA